ncbi:class I SAM-dependent rRNA methyltransferase, partial [Mucilaginibacter sp.]|uniref:class I SAM-dependent rRNA methyltransferase n=1 Tax=Mucilaginibacter sp. TaxID=1882438 RepID=UPI002ED40A15
MIDVILKKGKEKAVLQRHPWVFSGAIEKVKGKPANGDVVRLVNTQGEFMAYGFYNDQSRVTLRLLEWNKDAQVNEAWFREKVATAVKSRANILANGTNTCRLIFSESDYLPGLIVDKYAGHLAVQVLTSGIQNVMPVIIDELKKLLNPESISDKSDNASRAHEGLPEAENKVLAGSPPPELVEVLENNVIYGINITEGQKSGFYCDQRDNRHVLAVHTKDKKVLDCFCYTGGFTLNSLKEGAASVTSVDSSALAIETLAENIRLNKLDATKHIAIKSDVNVQLRKFRDEGEKFDVIVLDPPKYAPSRSALTRASRAYKDLNRLGMLLLNEGGLLATYSCSGAMDMETFKQVIAWAALDAGK